jgi:adenosylcobinamide-GDP ribazoletransferase
MIRRLADRAGRPPLIALQFLTRFPIRLRRAPSAEESGRALLWYPAVGLLVGLPGASIAALSVHFGNHRLVAAALAVSSAVVASGGLHLDGLADSADAWVGGGGDTLRTLAIMKDPCSGPIGVAAVVLVLLLKFAAIADLIRAGAPWFVAYAAALARGVIPLLLVTTPYVRRGGIGEQMAAHVPRRGAPLAALLPCAVGVAWLGLRGALIAAGAVAFAGWCLRRMMLARLGGTTGDTAGALIELLEMVALVAAVC